MTSPLGRAAPDSKSQLVVANSAPESRKRRSGAPPVAATTTSGFFRERLFSADEDIEAEPDAEPLAFSDPPVDDAEDFAPPFQRGGQQHLASRFRRRLEHNDLVSALRRDPRRF